MAEDENQSAKIPHSEAEWRARLSAARFHVLREKGTEPPFTGALVNEKRPGRYRCAGCNTLLYRADAKYDSGSGWPSFFAPADPAAVATERDTSHGMIRTELMCARCGGHLGHLFDDGPAPTGQRHCINSASLCFEPEE
jgi:peptide-methionine (R)-S-oxide reductase